MFFVVSTGRSGTQTIARALSQIPGCICLHEPAPELVLESSGYRCGTVSHADLAAILRATRAPVVDGAMYGESNQTLSLIIPVVAEVFPQARFIWLMRNGLDMVASAYQKQWYTGHSENHDRYEDCTPIEKMWIDGRIEGDRCGDMSAAEWVGLDRFGRCCWYWAYVNRVIERDLKRVAPDRFFFLRLEEIGAQFRNLIGWLGLAASPAPVVEQHNLAKRVPYHWTEWSETERRVFETWCGDLMDRFYPTWRTYTGLDREIFVTPAIEGLRRKIDVLSAQSAEQGVRLMALKAENSDLRRQLVQLKGE